MELHSNDYSYQSPISSSNVAKQVEVKNEHQQIAELPQPAKSSVEVSHDVSQVSQPILGRSSSAPSSMESHQVHSGSAEQTKHREGDIGNIATKNGKAMLENLKRNEELSGCSNLKRRVSDNNCNHNLMNNLNDSNAMLLKARLNSQLVPTELISSRQQTGGQDYAAKVEVAKQKNDAMKKMETDGMNQLLGTLPEGSNKEALKAKVEPMVKEIATSVQYKRDKAEAEKSKLEELQHSIDTTSNAPLNENEKAYLASSQCKQYIDSRAGRSWEKSNKALIDGNLTPSQTRSLLDSALSNHIGSVEMFLNLKFETMLSLEILDVDFKDLPQRPEGAADGIKFKKDFKYKPIANELTKAHIGRANELLDQTEKLLTDLHALDFGGHEQRGELLKTFEDLKHSCTLLFDPKVKEKVNSKIQKLKGSIENEQKEYAAVNEKRSAEERRRKILET